MSNPAETLTHPRVIDPSALPRIAERLKRDIGAEAVIVYGSVARDEATVDSDIDLPAPPSARQVRQDLDETRRLVAVLFPDEQLA